MGPLLFSFCIEQCRQALVLPCALAWDSVPFVTRTWPVLFCQHCLPCRLLAASACAVRLAVVRSDALGLSPYLGHRVERCAVRRIRCCSRAVSTWTLELSCCRHAGQACLLHLVHASALLAGRAPTELCGSPLALQDGFAEHVSCPLCRTAPCWRAQPQLRDLRLCLLD